MLESIRQALAPVSRVLAAPAILWRDGVEHQVLLNPHKVPRPSFPRNRAYDARFRMHIDPDGIHPQQNDVVSADRVNYWIVWSVELSPVGTYAMLDCMSEPGDPVTPVETIMVPDGWGGHTVTEVEYPERTFMAHVSSASIDRQLTAASDEQMGRHMIHYRHQDAGTLKPGERVRLRGLVYVVMSLEWDNTNPLWVRAVVAREG